MPKKERKYIRICPRCNSTDISTDFSNPGIVGTGLVNDAFVCNNCELKGSFFPEVDKKPKVKKKWR